MDRRNTIRKGVNKYSLLEFSNDKTEVSIDIQKLFNGIIKIDYIV